MDLVTLALSGMVLCSLGIIVSAQPLFSPDESIRITLERGMCFGTCPVYSVTLSGNGTVSWEGKQYVMKKGNITGSIDPARVADLFYQLDRDGFFTLNHSYSAYEITDMPSATLTVQNNSIKKQVYHYYGDSSAPETLCRMEEAVDRTANTTQWIGKEPPIGSEDILL